MFDSPWVTPLHGRGPWDQVTARAKRGTKVGFILLCASDYYDRKGPVCYVLTFYNQYIYSELSILILFILPRDTPAEVIYSHFRHFSD